MSESHRLDTPSERFESDNGKQNKVERVDFGSNTHTRIRLTICDNLKWATSKHVRTQIKSFLFAIF